MRCSACKGQVFRLSPGTDLCVTCQAKQAVKGPENSQVEDERHLGDERTAELKRHIVLTTETSHNLEVAERLGIVSAEYVVGMHLFRDIASAFRDTFGGRSQTMQRALKEARTAVLHELREEAFSLGADAVVGIDLDYSEISGGGKSMLFLVASGTAVKLREGGFDTCNPDN